MILADTSIWVDHLRSGDARLVALLESGEIVTHPFVVGELALGSLGKRKTILDHLSNLPRTRIAGDEEVLHFIERRALFGMGIGYVDAHLLASVQFTEATTLWTRDRRLLAVAESLSIAARIS